MLHLHNKEDNIVLCQNNIDLLVTNWYNMGIKIIKGVGFMLILLISNGSSSISKFEYEDTPSFDKEEFCNYVAKILDDNGQSGYISCIGLEGNIIVLNENIYYSNKKLDVITETEERDANAIVNKVGGSSGKNALNYKLSIPNKWAGIMGISKEDRQLKLTFDNHRIIVEKA